MLRLKFLECLAYIYMPFATLCGSFCLLLDSDKEVGAAKDASLGIMVVPKQVTSALSSLVTSYGSMSDSDSEQDGKSDSGVISSEWQRIFQVTTHFS